jgi:SNF2 family DNA or RNA helicase
VAYAKDGSHIVLPNEPRISVLEEIIEESEGKVLVFVPLTGVLGHVADKLEKRWTVARVHGETSKNERDQIFTSFQSREEPHVLVANPGTMSHGLTLTAATTIVWFAPIYSNDIYEQACARVRRPGQSRTTVIVHISASEIERKIYQRLQTKQKLQGLLLDLMKEDSENP